MSSGAFLERDWLTITPADQGPPGEEAIPSVQKTKAAGEALPLGARYPARVVCTRELDDAQVRAPLRMEDPPDLADSAGVVGHAAQQSFGEHEVDGAALDEVDLGGRRGSRFDDPVATSVLRPPFEPDDCLRVEINRIDAPLLTHDTGHGQRVETRPATQVGDSLSVAHEALDEPFGGRKQIPENVVREYAGDLPIRCTAGRFVHR